MAIPVSYHLMNMQHASPTATIAQPTLSCPAARFARICTAIHKRACAMAIHDGVRSYKQIKALTERLLAEALIELDTPAQGELTLTQNDPLIRAGEDYADLFNLGAQHSAALPPPLKESAP